MSTCLEVLLLFILFFLMCIYFLSELICIFGPAFGQEAVTLYQKHDLICAANTQTHAHALTFIQISSYLHRCHLWVCGFLRRKNTLVAKLMWACNYLFAGRCVIVWDICVNSSLTKHISHTYIHSRHRIILYFKSVKPLLQLTSIKLFKYDFLEEFWCFLFSLVLLF